MTDPENISWDIEIGDGKLVTVHWDGDIVVVFQNYGNQAPICLTRHEALALSEGLRRTAELIAPESN